MTIVLLILKIIGITLLIILGLAVLFGLLVLFVPLRYRAEGEYHNGNDSWYVKVRVSWLLHLLVLEFDISQDAHAGMLKILGIKKKMEKPDNTPDYEETIQEADESVTDEPPSADEPDRKEKKSADSTEEKPDEAAGEEEVSSEKRRARKNPIADFWRKIKKTCRRIRDAIKNFADTAARIKNLLVDERHHSAVKFFGGRLFVLLKRILPGKLMLNLRYSTGSPDTTGELLGVAAMFPVACRNRWNITPDFTADQAYAEAEFDVRGRIFSFHALIFGISILINEDCRYLYRNLKTIF